jgi:hypothetical protein
MSLLPDWSTVKIFIGYSHNLGTKGIKNSSYYPSRRFVTAGGEPYDELD